MTDAGLVRRRIGSSCDKIVRRHQDRLAIVYVRQSTAQQVERHQESTRLQYALADRAAQFGWLREQIVVIDDDLGRSGASVEGRLGFQRLVAEVGLGNVGLVLGVEMSRLARSCRDWHQLLEICALFDTLIADADGVYDPANYNDRLLLGLKGTMSEAELHILKARMLAGRKAKARRGELGKPVPIGHVRRPSGEVVFDPDEQAQATVRLVFDLFDRFRTVGKVMTYLVEHDIRMPVRRREGAGKGELEWRRVSRPTLLNLFANPIYAGVYAYGVRAVDKRRQRPGRPGTGRRSPRAQEAEVFLPDRLPGYISFERHERNQAQLKANKAAGGGTVRAGSALLSGVLICGRRGLRMLAQYNNNGHAARYVCSQPRSCYGEAFCQSLTPAPLDALVSGMVLKALEPAAIEASLALAGTLEVERAALDRHWRQRLERAAYEVERARRQYAAVEPENRLVARTLERDWEKALTEQARLEAEHERARRAQGGSRGRAGRDPRSVAGSAGALARRHNDASRAPDHRAPARRTGAGRGRRRHGKGSCRVSLAWRSPNDARVDAPGRPDRVTEHLRGVDGARRGTAPRRPRMREDRRDPQCRRMAPGQAPRHLQCANGSSSPARIGRGDDQVSPATATNRASGERMDDPRARRRDRHAAADPLHLGPEGTPILPQSRLRHKTRRARAR
jgi:DNA invertase Pin-like site-specific DNA recombinase